MKIQRGVERDIVEKSQPAIAYIDRAGALFTLHKQVVQIGLDVSDVQFCCRFAEIFLEGFDFFTLAFDGVLTKTTQLAVEFDLI